MRREDEVAREPALARQRLLQLGEMAMRVPDRVRAKVLGDFPKEQLAFGISSGARDAGGRVDDDFTRRIDKPELRERNQREQRGRRIAPRIRDELGIGEARPSELGQAVDRVRRQPEVGREIHGPLATGACLVDVAGRHAVRERRQDDLGLLPRGVIGLDQLVPVDPFPGRRLGGRKRDGGARMAVQQAQQLLTDIDGRTQHADRDRCMIIHLDGKLCRQPTRRKMSGRSMLRPYTTRSSLGLGRYDLPTLAHGFPSSITTSAVKSNRPWNRLEPTPYTSTGTRCSSNCRILSTVKPPETTILTCLKPSASSARRTFQTSCGFTPVGLNVPICGMTDLSTRVSDVSSRTPYSRSPSSRARASDVPTQSLSKSTSVMRRIAGSECSANVREARTVSPL